MKLGFSTFWLTASNDERLEWAKPLKPFVLSLGQLVDTISRSMQDSSDYEIIKVNLSLVKVSEQTFDTSCRRLFAKYDDWEEVLLHTTEPTFVKITDFSQRFAYLEFIAQDDQDYESCFDIRLEGRTALKDESVADLCQRKLIGFEKW